MRTFFAAAIAVICSACAASPAVLPDPAIFLEEMRAGRADLSTFNFTGSDYWQRSSSERLTWYAPIQAGIIGSSPRVSIESCEASERKRLTDLNWLMLLFLAQDSATWSTNFQALHSRRKTFEADLTAATRAIPSRSGDPRVAELQRRFVLDQAVRDTTRDAQWAAGLPALAATIWPALKFSRSVEIDCENTAWLRTQLGEIGWFDIPTFGAEADSAAFYLAQHADRSPEFQRAVLAYLETLPAAKTSRRNVAYLSDRIAGYERRPQRYGTQGTCQSDGTWKPNQLDDPDGVEARRASMGLDTLAENAARVARENCLSPASP
jgi:hypothetical protein